MNIQFKKASENDIDFLLDLRIKTMNEHLSSSNLPTDKEFHLQRIKYRFDNAQIILLNDEPIGLLKTDRSADKIEIIQIQIDPRQQGKGIGKTILKDIIEEGLSVQKPITLSVLKTNKAQSLYAGLGFKIIDEDEYSYMMRFSN
ncbi:GNAT family N-acetyltransferase [Chryseobacterium populi]|uniref:Acetyltransferase, N-acetylglutamate synthase n=1 Tax=Chryseobacterium populi TaxID=1144316 RepID=J2T9N2_9FLAO|nr:GNAT family N-acetyltransferase [Chryseobacterium populi]EJL74832.1 acetyltransferase, N-acetylglutamate synthase [Chryseobacterium populi]